MMTNDLTIKEEILAYINERRDIIDAKAKEMTSAMIRREMDLPRRWAKAERSHNLGIATTCISVINLTITRCTPNVAHLAGQKPWPVLGPLA